MFMLIKYIRVWEEGGAPTSEYGVGRMVNSRENDSIGWVQIPAAIVGAPLRDNFLGKGKNQFVSNSHI